MQAQEKTLIDFLRAKQQFTIPIYQRTYSWTPKQCLKLWQDIKEISKSDEAKYHFMGPIVRIKQKLDSSEISEQVINIYTSYKQQLKIFQKKYFDPFSRGDRIPYFMKNNCVITTIGQLNFFKWFFSKNVFTYIMNNLDTIENDMNKKNKLDKKKDTKHKLKTTPHNNIIHKFTNKVYNNKINSKTIDNIIVSFSF